MILGSPGEFKAEHNEGEPDYVYVKPITKDAAQSNLLIATRSGQHVALEFVSGAPRRDETQPVDFLIEYRAARSFLIPDDSESPAIRRAHRRSMRITVSTEAGPPADAAVESRRSIQAARDVNAPKWTKWEDNRSKHRSATCGS